MEKKFSINDILYELKKEHPINDMIQFNELDVEEKLQNNEMNTMHYWELYIKELATLERMEAIYEKLVGKRYEYFRFEDNRGWQKYEIEKYALPADKKISKMKKLMIKQKIRVRFFEGCYKRLDKMGWSMKTFIDIRRGGL